MRNLASFGIAHSIGIETNKFMNKYQIIGIGIIIAGGIIGYFFEENNIISTLSGVLCAVGLTLILKWFPIKKKKSTE